jgi:hypothetical protein
MVDRSHHGRPTPDDDLAAPWSLRHTPPVLPDEQIGPDQLAVLRTMTPGQKWEAARRLYWSARRLKAAFLRSEHPEWTEAELDDAVRRSFLYART